jgi:hypothetical protein
MIKKVKIKTEEDLETLPEDEVVEVESCDIKFRLIEKWSLISKKYKYREHILNK